MFRITVINWSKYKVKIFKLLLIVLFVVIFNLPSFADVIGCDVDGIVCLDDDLELFSNEFRTLDLDFDGRHELYYFDISGRLGNNNFINDFFINERGQQTFDGDVVYIDIEPEDLLTYQIDNLDFYYINKVKSKFNENWEIQSKILKAKVNIDIPEIAGENKSIVEKINNQLNTRGLELLKLYAEDEVYKRDTKKFSITINKFVRDDVQKLNFVPMLDNKFYFNFDVNIILNNKNELHKSLGLCVDTDTCYITNFDLQDLNIKIYENVEYIKSGVSNYNTQYKDYVENLKKEYVDALVDYIYKYEEYINDYEVKNGDANNRIRAINNYIKNIDSVYNTYSKFAKNSYQNNEIDEETYKYIIEDFKVLLNKYKETLSKKLKKELDVLK